MGMHQPGWREKNEEQAWEAWELEVSQHLTTIVTACNAVAARAITRNPGADIVDAINRMEEATEALWQLRDGPEPPDA